MLLIFICWIFINPGTLSNSFMILIAFQYFNKDLTIKLHFIFMQGTALPSMAGTKEG